MTLAREWTSRAFGALLIAAAAAFVAAGCGSDATEDKAAGEAAAHVHAEGPHGGPASDVKDGTHMEALHDTDAGAITVYFFTCDPQTMVTPAEAPLLNVRTSDGPVQVTAEPAAESGFSFTHDALKNAHVHGQVVVSLEGEKYYVELPHEHDDSGHAHEGESEEEHDHDHAHGENTVSCTAWTETCEWFVELDMPEKGCPAAFAAHVTLLEDFSPALSGTFSVTGRSGSQTTATSADMPARPGIFTPEITFPETGEWVLTLSFDSGSVKDSIEWTVTVYEHGEAPEPAEDEAGLISFLKEAQWKTDFATCVIGSGSTPSVPQTAVLDEGGERFVLVQVEGEAFEKRQVETGASDGGTIEITSGLKAGERVVNVGCDAILK